MEKSFTKDGARWFTCRRCGVRNYESLNLWKKKPQSMKNVCALCIDKEELAHQEARERAHYSPFQYPF